MQIQVPRLTPQHSLVRGTDRKGGENVLNHTFTKKETAILLILVALLLAMGYYQFVYKWQQKAIAQFDTTDIETAIAQEQAKAIQIKRMQEEIASGKKEKTGIVETYSNLKAELRTLNDIFGDALNFDFSFDQAVADGDAVRRTITCTVTAASYQEAKGMLRQLHDCEYRCLIGDVSISPSGTDRESGDRNLNAGNVTMNFSVTFYETLYGAKSTDGLQIRSSSSDSTGENLLGKLSESREQAENTGNENQ